MSLVSRPVTTTRLFSSASTASARLTSLNSHLSTGTRNFRRMSSLPKTQKAVFIEKTGGPEVLQYKTDVPVVEPKEGEVLVKNEYIGINYIDT